MGFVAHFALVLMTTFDTFNEAFHTAFEWYHLHDTSFQFVSFLGACTVLAYVCNNTFRQFIGGLFVASEFLIGNILTGGFFSFV